MNVASLELSKTLYELSGWECGWWYPFAHISSDNSGEHIYTDKHGAIVDRGRDVPAYDLGYLLRKLPPHLDKKRTLFLAIWIAGAPDRWGAGYMDTVDPVEYPNYAPTPEDAACKLLIELINHGIVLPQEEKR